MTPRHLLRRTLVQTSASLSACRHASQSKLHHQNIPSTVTRAIKHHQTAIQPRCFSVLYPSRQSQPDYKPKIYDFDAIKSLTTSPNSHTVLIDVREPSELQQSSVIPSSINIPLQSSPDALFMAPDAFEEKFGFEKPDVEGDEVVFFCKAGVRSRAAARLAVEAGYKKVGEYPGSYLDWAKNTGAKTY